MHKFSFFNENQQLEINQKESRKSQQCKLMMKEHFSPIFRYFQAGQNVMQKGSAAAAFHHLKGREREGTYLHLRV